MSKIESVSYIAFHNLDGLDGLDSGVGAFTIVGMRHMHVVGRLALMVRMPRTIPCPGGEAHTDGPHRVAMLQGSLPLRLLIIFELHICVLLAVVFELYSTQEEGTTPEPGRAGKGKGEEEGEEVVVVASEPEARKRHAHLSGVVVLRRRDWSESGCPTSQTFTVQQGCMNECSIPLNQAPRPSALLLCVLPFILNHLLNSVTLLLLICL